MKDVRKLLTKRDQLFKSQTDVVVTHLQPITAGIKEFLESVDPSYKGGAFIWQDIGMYDDDLLMLMGKVLYPVGYELMLDGNLVIIDEENQEYFNRALRIGIPISIVNLGEAEPVVEFLAKLHHNHPVLEERMDIDDGPVVKLKSDESTHLDFDLEALTDEQLASLKMFSNTK